jgi:NAD(P)-dependent dehydrogenase (short-subunit alcohol dehydrogenase family)
MNVAGKVIAVTGGANGIGRHVVLELLRRGARVAAVDVRQDGLDEIVEVARAGDRLATFQVDITDRAAVEELPTKVADRFGVVDGLVNVAHIANVSSMGGFLPVPGQTVYGASKAAVKLLVRVRRMMSHRVRRIVSVHPG